MLSCGDMGCFVWHCPKCNEFHIQSFGCNSRLCSSCGKRYTDKWADRVAKSMFNVTHRHMVMTIPDRLWSLVKEHRFLQKVLMDSAIVALNDTLSYFLRKDVNAGAIVVLHPFGRDLVSKSHVHAIVTEGGFDKRGRFIPKTFIPGRAMRKTWQYQVLTNFKKALPKTWEYATLINWLFKAYDGFHVYLPKESRIKSRKIIARYIARYIRHPAIANSRIIAYDGKYVTFTYTDNEMNAHRKTMNVDDFISALIQHIPDKHFKMIRHYGAYSRRGKEKFRDYLKHEIMRNQTLLEFMPKLPPRCPVCGSPMDFVMYLKDGPPENVVFGNRITDWGYLVAS